MRPLGAQLGRVPARLSLVPASPVTRPGPGLGIRRPVALAVAACGFLDGQDTTIHELLAGFPAEARAAHAELAGLAAADELARGSLEAAERYLALAEQQSAPVPEGRRGQFQVLLGVARLLHARQRGNSHAVAGEARRLQAAAEAPAAEAPAAAQPDLDEDLRALALISLGSAEIWAARSEEAHRHLEQGVALARRVGRPFLEFSGLAELAVAELAGPFTRTAETGRLFARVAEHARQAIELARRHGWTGEPAFGVACRALGLVLAWQGRPEEAEPWVQLGERTVTAEAEPAAAAGVCFSRGVLELARGRDRDALAAFQAGERLAGHLDAPNSGVPRARAVQMFVLVRLGDTERAEQALAGMEERERERGDVRVATAALRLARDDPDTAAAALAPVLDGSASEIPWTWLTLAFLLEASARDALGDQGAASRGWSGWPAGWLSRRAAGNLPERLPHRRAGPRRTSARYRPPCGYLPPAVTPVGCQGAP